MELGVQRSRSTCVLQGRSDTRLHHHQELDISLESTLCLRCCRKQRRLTSLLL